VCSSDLIQLQGKKLTGNYVLLFMKEQHGQRQWLLFKLKQQVEKAS
jgi:hypothetical protein